MSKGRPRLEVGKHGTIGTSKATANEPARAWCSFRDVDGKTRVVTATGPSVDRARNKLLDKLSNRVLPSDQAVTAETSVRTLAETWLAKFDERTDRSANTKRRYREVTTKYVLPRMADLRLREVTPGSCDAVVQAISAEVGPPTAKLCRSALSGMFALAFSYRAVSDNPVRDVSVAVERRKPKALGIDDTRDLLGRLRADEKSVRADLPDLVEFLAATGCRIGEALAVRWVDLDLAPEGDAAPTVTIRGAVVWAKGAGLTRQEHRKAHEDDEPLVLALPSWIVPRLMARALAALPNEHDVVFPSSVGTLRDPTNFRDQWRAARKRLGVDASVTPKTLRKAVATAVANAKGADAAAEQLGHASDEVTRRHYIERTRRADHREIVEQFGPVADTA